MFVQKIKIKLLNERQMLLALLVIGVLSISAVIGVFQCHTLMGHPSVLTR